MINIELNRKLRYATRDLTGRREEDIDYLNRQLLVYRKDRQVSMHLQNILRSLSFTGQSSFCTAG